jgi:hypothetical protein
MSLAGVTTSNFGPVAIIFYWTFGLPWRNPRLVSSLCATP